jgi:hypothetical protein
MGVAMNNFFFCNSSFLIEISIISPKYKRKKGVQLNGPPY